MFDFQGLKVLRFECLLVVYTRCIYDECHVQQPLQKPLTIFKNLTNFTLCFMISINYFSVLVLEDVSDNGGFTV